MACHINLIALSVAQLLYNFSLDPCVENMVSISKKLPAAFARPEMRSCG